MILSASVQSTMHAALAQHVSLLPVFDSLPTSIRFNGEKEPPTEGWRALLMKTSTSSSAFWRNDEFEVLRQISYIRTSELLNITIPDGPTGLDEMSCFIAAWPFELAAFESPHKKAWIKVKYPTWGFGRSMIDHGWGCAFRGAGHDRLVSRRWLDFGPWRVLRRPNDTTFIQFHDLDLTDPAAAYAQAAPGHQRMGNDAIGGYLQHQLDWIIGDVKGLYLAETCSLEIVVGPHNTVDQEDMLSMCALRYKHRLTPPSTGLVRDIAYIFINRADAETHLHELWLRELQCWYVDGAGKHRLDHTYHPTPNPPDWVKRLNLRDATK